MAVELGQGYISVTAETRNIPAAIRAALGHSQAGATQAGRSIGNAMASSLGTALKVGAGVAAAGATAVVGTALTKGFQRLTAIDDAKGKLTSLGHDTLGVAKIMESALASVKGTSYGLGDAANIAASAVAAGVQPGKELTRYLGLTADAASIAGVSLQEMGQIINKVQTSGTAYTMEITQLADRGLPIWQWLATEMKKPQAEMKKLVAEGKVDSATYLRAIEKNIGGAATAATTVSSAWSNTMAAMSRIGAAGLKPTFDRLIGGFTAVTKGIDDATPHVERFAQVLDHRLFNQGVPALVEFGHTAREAFDNFMSANGSEVRGNLNQVEGVITSLWGTAKELSPSLLGIASSLAKASAATGVSTWSIFLKLLESSATILDATLVPALSGLSSIMNSNQGAVTALALGFLAFKTIPALVGRVTTAFAPVTSRVSGASNAVRGFGQHMQLQARFAEQSGRSLSRVGAAMATMETRSPAIARMGESYRSAASNLDGFSRRQAHAASTARALSISSTDAFKSIDAMTRAAGHSGAAAVGRLGSVAQGVGASGFSALKSGVSSLTSVVGGPMNMALLVGAGLLMSWTSNIQAAKSNVKAYEKSVLDVVKAQGDMTQKLLENGGKVDDSIISNLAGQIDKVGEGFESLGKNDAKWNNVASDMVGDVLTLGRSFNWLGDEISVDMDKAAQAQKDAKKAIDDTGMSSERLAMVVAGSQGSYDAFRRTLVDAGEGGILAAESLDGVRKKLLDSQEAARRVTPGIEEVGRHMRTLADETSTASEKADALKKTLDILANVPPDLEDSMQSYGKAVREALASTEGKWDVAGGFGGGLLNDDGSINQMVENGSRLRTELLAIRDETARVAQSGGDLGPIIAKNEELFGRYATATGLSVDEIRDLAKAQGYILPVIEMTARLEGAQGVTAELGGIWSVMNQIKPGEPKVVELTALTDEAQAALKDANADVKRIEENGVVTWRVTANNDEFIGKLGETLNKALEIDALRVAAKVGLDTKDLDLDAEKSKNLLGILSGLEAKPGMTLNLEKFNNAKSISLSDLAELSGKVANPSAILEIAKLLGDKNTADRELDAFVKKQRNIAIDVELRRINSIDQSLPAWSAERARAIWGIPENRNGGSIPYNASGGTITGPGTGTSDSVLGIDKYTGLPTSWVSAGEEVIKERSASKWRPLLKAINADAPWLEQVLPRHAEGGTVGEAIAAARSVEGNKYVYGGAGPTNFDCSGFVGWLQQILMGFGKATSRIFTTYSLIAGNTAGLVRGLNPASPFNVGTSEEHMAATLAGQPVESGGAHGTSGIGGSRAKAEDSQFPYKFHLPVEKIPGYEGTGVTGYGDDGLYTKASEWTEKDNLELESARVAITQAKEARDKVYANEKKSQADRDQADIKVRRAEQKVKDLEEKREGAGSAKSYPAAPDLSGSMTDEDIELRNAEIAVRDAELARDKVYGEPSTGDEKEKADMAVYSARNKLDEIQRKMLEDAKGGDGTRLKTFAELGADMGSILASGFLETFGLQEFGDPNKWITDGTGLTGARTSEKPKKPTKPTKPLSIAQMSGQDITKPPSMVISKEEAMSQLPITPGWSNPLDELLKINPINTFDRGGEARGLGFLPKAIIEPERVLDPPMSRDFNRLVNVLDSSNVLQALETPPVTDSPSPVRGGDHFAPVFQGTDNQQLFEMFERWWRKKERGAGQQVRARTSRGR